MKNEVKWKEPLWIFSSKFMTASPLAQSDYRIYWLARNLQEITASLSFFASREISPGENV